MPQAGGHVKKIAHASTRPCHGCEAASHWWMKWRLLLWCGLIFEACIKIANGASLHRKVAGADCHPPFLIPVHRNTS